MHNSNLSLICMPLALAMLETQMHFSAPTADHVSKNAIPTNTAADQAGPVLLQMVSLLHLADITEEGVTFASPADGSRMLLTPEHSIRIQNQIGASLLALTLQLQLLICSCPSLCLYLPSGITESVLGQAAGLAHLQKCTIHGEGRDRHSSTCPPIAHHVSGRQ